MCPSMWRGNWSNRQGWVACVKSQGELGGKTGQRSSPGKRSHTDEKTQGSLFPGSAVRRAPFTTVAMGGCSEKAAAAGWGRHGASRLLLFQSQLKTPRARRVQDRAPWAVLRGLKLKESGSLERGQRWGLAAPRALADANPCTHT